MLLCMNNLINQQVKFAETIVAGGLNAAGGVSGPGWYH